MPFVVVLDANVLYSIALTDLYISLSGAGLYRLHWSTEILAEAIRNLVDDHPEQTDAIKERFEDMKRAEPGAIADPPPALVAAMTNDTADRHVLASAVHAGAEVVVTFNLKHFPAESCEPHFIEAQHPDEFTGYLVDLSPDAVWHAIEKMASRKQNPPLTSQDVLQHLENKYLPKSMGLLRSWLEDR